MPIRSILAALALPLLAVSCSCERRAPGDDDALRAREPAASASMLVRRAPADAPADAAAAALQARRAAALHAAVDVVQRYLARLGGADRSAADVLWAYRRQPAPSEEAGLRALLPARAMRIQNGTPRVLDDEAVPTHVEVPVTLRVDTAAEGSQRYDGWYRVRWNPVQQEWELVAAAVRPAIR